MSDDRFGTSLYRHLYHHLYDNDYLFDLAMRSEVHNDYYEVDYVDSDVGEGVGIDSLVVVVVAVGEEDQYLHEPKKTGGQVVGQVVVVGVVEDK